MARSLLLFFPSYFWIQRLEFVIPIGCVLEKVRLQLFLLTAICFLFHALYFLEHYLIVLFVSISSTKWWGKKPLKKREWFKKVIKQERMLILSVRGTSLKKYIYAIWKGRMVHLFSLCALNTELKCAWQSEQIWNKISALCESRACAGGSGLGSCLLWSVVPSVGGTLGVWQIRGET